MKGKFKYIFIILLGIGTLMPSLSRVSAQQPSPTTQYKYCYTTNSRQGVFRSTVGMQTTIKTIEHCSDTMQTCMAAAASAGGTTCYRAPADTQDGREVISTSFGGANECFSTGGGINVGVCLKKGAAWGVSIILWLMSQLLRGVAALFDLAIKISIVDFKSYADLAGITLAWTLGRDLANIFFIFILLFAALNQVLGVGWLDTKKVVANVIIVALLINFSALLPKVIIDISNILSSVFYQQMNPVKITDPAGKQIRTTISGALVQEANPNIFMSGQPLSGSTAQNADAPVNVENQQLTWSSIIVNGVGTFILMIVLAYALIIFTFLMFVRTIILLFAIALSSLAVFAWTFPGTKKLFDDWWQRLIGEAVFAPASLFLLYVVIKTVTSPDFNTLTRTGTDWLPKISGYILVISMVLASIFIAKKFSKMGEQVAKKVKDKSNAWLAAGGGALGGYTIGRAGQRFADSDFAKNMAAKSPRMASIVRSGAAALGSAKFGTKMSFKEREDARAKSLAGKMEGMNDTQKTQFTQNLKGGIGSKAYDWIKGGPSQELLYKKGMSEDDRGRLEKENQLSVKELRAEKLQKQKDAGIVALTAAETTDLASLEKEKNSAEQKRKYQETLRNLRGGLTGKDRGQAQIERFKAMKSEDEQLSELEQLEEKDRAKVVEGLSDSTIAKLKIRAEALINSTNPNDQALGARFKPIMEASTKEFDLERSGKITKLETDEAAKRKSTQNIQNIRTHVNTLITNPTDAAAKAELLSSLRSGQRGTVGSLGDKEIDHILGDKDAIFALGPAGVVELSNHKSMNAEKREKILQAVADRQATSTLTPLTKNEEAIIKMVQDPSAFYRLIT